MAKNVTNVIEVRPDFQTSRQKNGIAVSTGYRVKKHLYALFDSAANDSSGVSNKTVATHGLGIFLPPKAIVVRTWYQVVTGFTSATSTATVAIQAATAGDVKAATLVSDATLASAALEDAIQTGAASAFVQLGTSELELKVVVAVQALTAGKLLLVVEYVQGL